MEVIVADKCGFCPGVNNAISTAEKILAQENDVYSLGPIIHNRDVVEKLAKAGLRTVDAVEEIPFGTVLIRSHGVAPDQLARIEEKGLKIVDATCVLVKRVQRIARELDQAGYEVVVIGDKNHPEVQAVVGCARDVVVVADESDLHKLPRNKKLGVVCQTTESPGYFTEMLAAIAKQGVSELRVINTLCREAVEREKSAVELCRRVDVMFVLGGLESANTRKLAELCREYNPRTFHLQNWKELDKKELFDKTVAGVTAGASTPQWVITRFVEHLAAFDSSGNQSKG
ncbi:MAG: 4-hydroxy-3-methylbut-2-enyl diphosphate reductase [Planctomycetota bacterium]|jgi:4-hydroxy-3-methylbut-2-enyl diphosphate reductase